MNNYLGGYVDIFSGAKKTGVRPISAQSGIPAERQKLEEIAFCAA